MYVDGMTLEKIETVKEFIYLGIKLVNNKSTPEAVLVDRM